MTSLHRTMAAIGLLLLLAGTAAAAIPGPQRALCPQCFGLTRIADGVFSDAPERSAELAALARQADVAAAEFYGGLESRPRLILCARADCAARFGGGGPAGATYGWHLVQIAPKGLNQVIVTHERLHAELNHRLSLAALAGDPVPVWFNEGLATHLSGDTRFPGPFADDDIAWIRSGTTRREWRRLLATGGWAKGYGAAAAAVARLQGEIGNDGLRRVIERVAAGAPFDAALAAENSL